MKGHEKMSSRIGSLLAGHPGRVAAALATVAMSMLLAASVSLGAGSAGPPHFQSKPVFQQVFSTRAEILMNLEPEHLVTRWSASYSSDPTGPWATVNSGEVTEEDFAGSSSPTSVGVFVGAYDHRASSCSTACESIFLRGLVPGKSYYVRFTAKNADGEAEKVIAFKTLPVEKPEVDDMGLQLDAGTSFQTLDVLAPDTTAGFFAKIDANGALTTYNFEYAPAEAGGGRPGESSGSWQEFTSGATGTISEGEEYRWMEATIAGLKPESTYYVRLKASNAQGPIVQTKYWGQPDQESFTTFTAKPSPFSPGARNVTANSAFLHANVAPHGSQTQWRFEFTSEPENAGSWSVVPGGSGRVSQAEAEAQGYSGDSLVGARLSSLSPSTTYYVRAFAQNACAENCSVTSETVSFTTSGAPGVGVFSAHGLNGETLSLSGWVNPHSARTSAEQLISIEGAVTGGSFTLSFDGRSTGELPYDASAKLVAEALRQVAEGVEVSGEDGGPYTVYFGDQDPEVSEPSIEGDGLGLVPARTISTVTTLAGGVGYETHYRFQYVGEKSFTEHGWAQAQEGPEVDVGPSTSPEYVAYDLPALTAGETYRYRMVAQNNAPGTGLVESSEATLTVPLPAAVASESCPNAAFRVGASARLPDCRAYEQLTPVDKNGAEEPFHYGVGLVNTALVGEDGQHAVLEAIGTDYAAGPEVGQAPYLFSREAGAWGMLAGTPQPSAGVSVDLPQAYSSDLTQVALESSYAPSLASRSADVEFKLGTLGGPYSTVASVPQMYVQAAGGEPEGWVAANGDFSKLVLASQDRSLLGEETATKSGADLYEYSTQRGLAQLNVIGEPAATIGSCGALMVHGAEDLDEQVGEGGSPHSISADGTRVFFEAESGSKCGEETPQLYMRSDGSETLDIGPYAFLGASADGSSVLMRARGGAHEVLLYDTASKSMTLLPGFDAPYGDSTALSVSANLAVAYYAADASLYRYDIGARNAERLFSYNVDTGKQHGLEVSPDGRYVYFEAESVLGLPGGAGAGAEATQVYRYDSSENVVQCISCASPYDPAPRQPAFLGSLLRPDTHGGGPLQTWFSGNGDYAFFTTPAALVREDVDGETPIEGAVGASEEGSPFGDFLGRTSPSSDIYEWRKDGVHGCGQLAGCVAMLTGGHGGYRDLMLGSADEGRDLFIYTREKLVPQDDDTAGDIYDVREGGGFAPPPPRPTECEADSCSIPPSPPLDATPSSLTFTGTGNVLTTLLPKAPTGPKKPKKVNKKKKVKDKSKATKGKAKKAARRRRATKAATRRAK